MSVQLVVGARAPRPSLKERFPSEIRPLADNPSRRLNFRTICCSDPKCKQRAALADNTRGGLPEDVVAKKFQQMGWAIGKKGSRDLCPEHANPGKKRADLGRIVFERPPERPSFEVVPTMDVLPEPEASIAEPEASAAPDPNEPVDQLARRLLGDEAFDALIKKRRESGMKIFKVYSPRGEYETRASALATASGFGTKWLGFPLRTADVDLIKLETGKWTWAPIEDRIKRRIREEAAADAPLAEAAPKPPAEEMPMPPPAEAAPAPPVEEPPAPPPVEEPPAFPEELPAVQPAAWPTAPPQVADAPPTARQPSQQQRKHIREALDDLYDTAAGRYRADWTDRKVGADLDVPWAWVTQLREAAGYGPDENEEANEMKLLVREAASLRADIEKHALKGLELTDRAEAVQKRVNALMGKGAR